MIEGNPKTGKKLKRASSSKLKGASAFNQMSTALVKDRRDNIDNTAPEETSESVQVPVPAMQVIGNFVINAMKLFEQAEGVPDELVQLGSQAQSALQSISAPD